MGEGERAGRKRALVGSFFLFFFFEGSGYVEVNEGSLGDDVVVGDGQ